MSNITKNSKITAEEINKLLDEISKKISLPIGFEYFQTNPNVRTGHLPLIGGLYSRELYADLWSWIQSQTGYLITEEEWQQKATLNDGAVPFYSDGDGSTTFRVPALTVWCKGKKGDEAIGDYLSDSFKSHKHNVSVISYANVTNNGNHTHNIVAGWPTGSTTPSGQDVIEYDQYNERRGYINDALGVSPLIAYSGDHSHTVTISNSITEEQLGEQETKPKTIIGLYCVVALGSISSIGTAEAENILSQVEVVSSNIGSFNYKLNDIDISVNDIKSKLNAPYFSNLNSLGYTTFSDAPNGYYSVYDVEKTYTDYPTTQWGSLLSWMGHGGTKHQRYYVDEENITYFRCVNTSTNELKQWQKFGIDKEGKLCLPSGTIWIA